MSASLHACAPKTVPPQLLPSQPLAHQSRIIPAAVNTPLASHLTLLIIAASTSLQLPPVAAYAAPVAAHARHGQCHLSFFHFPTPPCSSAHFTCHTMAPRSCATRARRFTQKCAALFAGQQFNSQQQSYNIPSLPVTTVESMRASKCVDFSSLLPSSTLAPPLTLR